MDQQRKVVLFIAMSLDGYIATEEDTLEWLFKVEGEGDNGYTEFYETIDTILMGRRTYEWILEYMGRGAEFPYQGKECYVFSTTAHTPDSSVVFVQEDISSFIKKIKNQPSKNIWLAGGGELIRSFLKEKLIDEMRITVAPVVIGKGISLFKPDDYHLELSLKQTKQYNQFVELHYEVKK